MMATRRATSHREPEHRISPEEYAVFIAQIELRDIWLQQAHAKNQLGPEGPRGAIEVEITDDTRWHAREGGFDAIQQFALRFALGDAPLAEIEVTFALRFRSAQAMTEEIFQVFRAVNLPLNTWPYLREFVSATTGRMGWLPFTLPALKRGTPQRTDTEPTPVIEKAPRASRRSTRTSPSSKRSATPDRAS